MEKRKKIIIDRQVASTVIIKIASFLFKTDCVLFRGKNLPRISKAKINNLVYDKEKKKKPWLD